MKENKKLDKVMNDLVFPGISVTLAIYALILFGIAMSRDTSW